MKNSWTMLAVVGLAFGARAQETEETNYQVTNLPSLGGTRSAGNSINNRGWIAGFSNQPGNHIRHAAAWIAGSIVDLKTLGGPHSSVAWPVKNNSGAIVGISETAMDDPLGEAWSCSAFFPTATGKQCLGFVWEGGAMRALPTLGGNNGYAAGANSHGQVVGWAETTVHDPSCNPPQVLQFLAVIWGPGDRIARLPPMPGDSTSAATAINEHGQVVGISGACADAVGGFSAKHAVLWQDGAVTDLGGFGGTGWNTAAAINQNGDVVGFANLPGDEDGSFQPHAFLWTRSGGIRDLETLPGDTLSEGLGINDNGQVVGMSCTAGFAACRAFIWEGGVMADLNDRAPGYSDHLYFANDINDDGVITGQARRAATGERFAFRAIPL